MADDPRAELIHRIEATRERWRRLAADVGQERMGLPGAMGDWTFKDVASHLTAWRRRGVERLEAAVRGEPPPSPAWAGELPGETEDDAINDWIHERTRDQPLAAVLADADAIYDPLIAAVRALPLKDLTDPNRFDWLEGQALIDWNPGVHMDEHEPDVRRWLASAQRGG